VVTVPARRQVAAFFRSEFGLSERRACRLIGLHRSTSRYARQRDEDKELRLRLRAWAARRPRWGYRMLQWQLEQEGLVVNRKRVYRLYREEGLRLRKRRRKHLAAAPREGLAAATSPNERWAMDFMSDEFEDGRSLRLLNVIDHHTRECPAVEAGRSLPADRVIRCLERAGESYGFPKTIVVDNGPEFASKVLNAWAHRRGIELYFIEPGKPVQNAFIESFNGTCRAEFLNQELFVDEPDAQRKAERWRRHYNEERPHSALGNRTPAEFGRETRGLRPRTPAD
jgi:putative transposase